MIKSLKRLLGYKTCPCCDCQHTWAIFGNLCGQCGIDKHVEKMNHIDAQDAKIAALVEVAQKVPERWAWGSGMEYRHRVCKDCGAVGEYGSWDSPLPHKMRCTYAQARAALAAAKETT